MLSSSYVYTFLMTTWTFENINKNNRSNCSKLYIIFSHDMGM